jgi:hypothetical protein
MIDGTCKINAVKGRVSSSVDRAYDGARHGAGEQGQAVGGL